MRFMKKMIILLVIIIIGLPLAIVGAALIKDATPPAYLEDVDVTNYKPEATILNELDKYMMQFLLGDQNLIFEEAKVNELIYAQFKGFKDNNGIRALWVQFEEEELTLYTILSYSNINTTVTMRVDVEQENNSTKITLDTFKVGKMPIPKFAFKTILRKFGDEIIGDYKYGEINEDELYITIFNDVMQEQINKQVNNNFIVFDYITFSKGQFMIKCNFNPDNAQGLALQNTINELKSVIEDNDKLLNKLNGTDTEPGILDESNPAEKALGDDLVALQQKITDISSITQDDIELIESIQENYQNISPDKQQEIADMINNNFDLDTKADFSSTLEALGIEGYDNISDILLGKTNTGN
jgi:hypothetical protein